MKESQSSSDDLLLIKIIIKLSSIILFKFKRNRLFIMSQVFRNNMLLSMSFSFLQFGQIQILSFFFTEFMQLLHTTISQIQ
jgi:hypothetical protein